MRYIVERFRRFCGFLTGFVFFISGILKLLDPVGAGLVMEGYLSFLHIGFPEFAAKTLGTIFALAETIIGTALITGVWRKATAAAAMGLQAFFTLLTLALVIFNPSMDCGCFGEAVHLSHFQTFFKNLILCALLGLAFIPFRGFGRPRKRKYVSFGIVVAAVLAFTVYSWVYIPPVDFTDYKPSAVLASAVDGTEDMYEAEFIYEKDGVRERFAISRLPDSTWTYISTETRRKQEEGEVPVSLSFTDVSGEYRDSIAADGDVMVISIYDDTKMNCGKWEKIAVFAENASKLGFRPIVLLPSCADLSQEIPDEIVGKMYFSDYKTLITLNRSNGGATYFSDGVLISKWSYVSLPDSGKLEELSKKNGLELAMDKDTKGSLGFQGFLLYVFAVMLLL